MGWRKVTTWKAIRKNNRRRDVYFWSPPRREIRLILQTIARKILTDRRKIKRNGKQAYKMSRNNPRKCVSPFRIASHRRSRLSHREPSGRRLHMYARVYARADNAFRYKFRAPLSDSVTRSTCLFATPSLSMCKRCAEPGPPRANPRRKLDTLGRHRFAN